MATVNFPPSSLRLWDNLWEGSTVAVREVFPWLVGYNLIASLRAQPLQGFFQPIPPRTVIPRTHLQHTHACTRAHWHPRLACARTSAPTPSLHAPTSRRTPRARAHQPPNLACARAPWSRGEGTPPSGLQASPSSGKGRGGRCPNKARAGS